MVVVVLITTGAAICLRLYKVAQSKGGDQLEKAMFSIKQQAGVMAALAATVFAVLQALTTGKAATVAATAAASVPTFGTQRGAPAAAQASA